MELCNTKLQEVSFLENIIFIIYKKTAPKKHQALCHKGYSKCPLRSGEKFRSVFNQKYGSSDFYTILPHATMCLVMITMKNHR